MGARLALAAVLPPQPRRAAVGVVDRRVDRVQQARVVAAGVERAEALEELLAVAAAQVVDARDVQARELAGDRRPDVRDALQVAEAHAAILAHRAAGVL